MLADPTYVYNGVARLSFGLPSPNYAGALCATVLPIFWGVCAYCEGKQRRGWMAATIIGEFALFFALSITFSRGALVAVAVGLTHNLAARGVRTWRMERLTWITRVVGYAAIVGISGMAGRFTDIIDRADPSALHRLDYWKAGTLALRHIPILGVSRAEALDYFANWCGPIDGVNEAGGFLNTYFEWGMRWGVPMLVLLLAAILLCCLYPLAPRRDAPQPANSLTQIPATMIAVYAAAAFFSSLLGLRAVNVALLVIVGANLWLWLKGSYRRGRTLFAAMALSGATVAFASLLPISTPDGLSILTLRSGVISVQVEGAETNAKAAHTTLWCDEGVMGKAYGKEVRRFAAAMRKTYAGVYAVPHDAPKPPITTDTAVIFGSQWRELMAKAGSGISITLVHPIGVPNPDIAKLNLAAIVLPAIDEEGSVAKWIDFASSHTIPIIRSPGGHRLLENWASASPSIAAGGFIGRPSI